MTTLRIAQFLSPILILTSLASMANAQAAPPTAPAAPTAAAPPAAAPVAPPMYPQPYYAPPPGYYPPQGYWVPAPVAPLKERAYTPGAPVPPGYHVEERHPRWALITGITMLGSAYVTALLFASEKSCSTDLFPSSSGTYSSSCQTRWAMAVPVVGPFVDLAQNSGKGDQASMDVFVGAGELAGAIILVYGLATNTPKLIPDTQARGFRIAPMVGSASTGLTLTLIH